LFSSDPAIASTIQDPYQLFRLLGTFWQNYLDDSDLLAQHQWAKLQIHGDVYLRTVEMAAAASIQQVEPFCARQWKLIRLLQSELTEAPNIIAYGSGVVYGDGSVYGQLKQNSYVWQLDTQIKDIGLLLDSVIEPQHVYDVSNCIFHPANSTLSFATNPFTQIQSIPVYDATGNIVDQQILLWARNVSIDHQTPWLRYGSIVKISGQSSVDYCRILEACWSMLVNGPSIHDLIGGLMASTGLPVTQGNETVQLVQTDADGLAIITERNVYRFHAGATALVDAGDSLVPDQSLVDTLVVEEFCQGVAHDYSSLPGIACGPELLDGVVGVLVFPNDGAQTWQYVNTDAQCKVFGTPDDIEDFWSLVHARGLSAGKTLAQWLGVVSSGTVPVNPMKFVIDNFIGPNLIVVTVKPQHFLAFQPGFISRLRDLMPAGQYLLFQMNLTAAGETYGIAGTANTCTVYPALLGTTAAKTHTTDYSDSTPFIAVT
jgi:hypothetical protein